MKAFANLRWFFRGLKVFALVGASGTGKSYRAKLLMQKYGIEVLIDDGLLIRENKILAGHSAKREETYMGAVRAALFDDKKHRDEVAKALDKLSVKKILILGTSEKMVKKIALRLQLPNPEKIVKIEDIATREQIEAAQFSRRVEGKHVIPVPSIEVRRDYPQIFYDRVKVIFRRKKILSPDTKEVFEKSLVRPEFSKTGKVEISQAALMQMFMHCIMEFGAPLRIIKMSLKISDKGYAVVLHLSAPYGYQLTETEELRDYMETQASRITGIVFTKLVLLIDKFHSK